MDRHELILSSRLIPCPKSLRLTGGTPYAIQKQNKILLNVRGGEGASLRKKAESLFREYWNVSPRITQGTAPVSRKSPEAYEIEVTEKQLTVTVSGMDGLLNAFKTLRQLAEVNRGTEKVTGYFLVPCVIKDEPAMAFRGIHLCIFPETPLWDIEKTLRLAAYHKFNYAVIETWGRFPFRSHPEFCWDEFALDRRELKKLIRLGKELGITLIPQFNLLGHASACREITGKHTVLDRHPELEPLFEPAGWTWCLSNPESRRILTDLVLELFDFFEKPPFFHIGCDEAYDIGSCFECAKHEVKDLLKDHLLYFRDLFRKRGAKIIMWHDMLIDRKDPRWTGYVAHGKEEHKLSELYRELPKDIIIADWQYGGTKAHPEDPDPTWPTMKFFKKAKFSVLVCPWLDLVGTESLGKLAKREKLLGMLETTWHIYHDFRYQLILGTAACAAWNPDVIQPVQPTRFAMAQHLRQATAPMKLKEYEKFGFVQKQVNPGELPDR